MLDAAARLFAERGFHDAGISDIATETGVAHGTVYRYFKSKQEIANRIVDRVIQRIAQTILQEDPEAANTVEEYEEQLRRILSRLFDLYAAHPHLMRFFQRQSLGADVDAGRCPTSTRR